jgi:hypothetical protein
MTPLNPMFPSLASAAKRFRPPAAFMASFESAVLSQYGDIREAIVFA